MNGSEVKALLESTINDCDVTTEGEGCNFRIMVVSSEFEGMPTVKRQQLVYSHLQDAISSGAIHAITIKTYTPAQYSTL